MRDNINKYQRKFASTIKINDVIKYNGDHYDVSNVEKEFEGYTKIRALSFTKDSIIDGNFRDDQVFDVLKTKSKGIF